MTPAQAEQDGLRPCLRCRPNAGMDPLAQRFREICRHIEDHSDESLKLKELAAQFQMSPFHFQRTFKAVVGVTPKRYQDAARLRKLKQELKEANGVAQAVYGAGYGSSSRVYEHADTRLGMTPNQYRRGGEGVAITYTAMASPLDLMMIGATDRGLCFLQFGSSEQQLLNMLRREYPLAYVEPMKKPYHPDFKKWVDALNRYMAGVQPRLDLPLDIRATVFQMKVWNYLQSIPYGEVQSYGEVAAAIGAPASARAVARACATNRVALVIPCHRVVRGSGELGGYRWGLARKRVLLDRERAHKSG